MVSQSFILVVCAKPPCHSCRTFQEGFLSERLLVFTDHQTSFYCPTSSWTECLGNPDPIAAHQVHSTLFDGNDYLTSSYWNWNHFASILEDYSARQITKETDTLDAILGVIKHIQRSQPVTRHLRGLPFFKTSGMTHKVVLIDSIEEMVTAALSWQSCEDKTSSPRRLHTFPSWTWAGWSGEVSFWIRSIREARHQSFLRNVRLESASAQVVASSILYNDNTQHQLDTVTLIQFEAPTVPFASFSITEPDLIGTDLAASNLAEGYQFKVAGRTLFRNRHPDIFTFESLIENVQIGIWSCFMLCAGRYSKEDEDEERVRFVLVVR
jgi:hypothetical protein